MVVFSIYFARSGAGMGVTVGSIGVAVGKGVVVAAGVNDAAGMDVGVEAKDVQEEKINVNRKKAGMDGVNLFRMGCILPLVIEINNYETHNFL
jgi:hypothetical protein